jgi:hypothetical protein
MFNYYYSINTEITIINTLINLVFNKNSVSNKIH